MREIKFRGKRVENNEWIFGYYVLTHDSHRIIYEDYEGFYFEEEVIPESVGQWTGLFDRHGKEIYEGDILETTSELLTNLGRTRTGRYHTSYNKVIWKDDGWGYEVIENNGIGLINGFQNKGLLNATKYSKVIGNIYENPNLIK